MVVLHLDAHEAQNLAWNIGPALEDEVIERMRRFMVETYANLAEPFDV
jgi:Mn-dependent DtxR family transcriptional regulator